MKFKVRVREIFRLQVEHSHPQFAERSAVLTDGSPAVSLVHLPFLGTWLQNGPGEGSTLTRVRQEPSGFSVIHIGHHGPNTSMHLQFEFFFIYSHLGNQPKLAKDFTQS